MRNLCKTIINVSFDINFVINYLTTMEADKNHLRHIMLYAFRKNDNSAVALENVRAVYPNSLSKATVKRWFARFRSGDFSLEDELKPGRNMKFDTSVLEALVESNPKLTTREMASELNTNHTTIERHLEHLGKVHRFSVWVPH